MFSLRLVYVVVAVMVNVNVAWLRFAVVVVDDLNLVVVFDAIVLFMLRFC